MNVVHVVPSFYPATAYGGPIHSVLGLCKATARAGHDVRVLTTNTRGLGTALDVPTNRDVQFESGLSVRYFKKIGMHSISFSLLRNLQDGIRWSNVVHLTAVYSFPTFPVLLLAGLEHKPVIWSTRGALQRTPEMRRRQLKRLWEWSLARALPANVSAHATSDAEAESIRQVFPNMKIAVIPNGVDIPDSFAHLPGSGNMRLLFLGRIDSRKALENLLLAAASLRGETEAPFHLTIAGDGDVSYVAVLRQLAFELGITQHVSFIGHVAEENRSALFGASDVLILPSHAENFGLVVAEALAHELPVIAARGTPWEGLETHGCGYWVANDPASLAAAVRRMAGAPRNEMGLKGREWMRESFGWDSIGRRMVDIYRIAVDTGVAH